MPDRPYNGGRFRIQSKATRKWLATPEMAHTPLGGVAGVYAESHIVPRDQGAVWEVEDYLWSGHHFYRFTTTGPFYKEREPGEVWRLDSNQARQVYAHPQNDTLYQLWNPIPLPDGYFALTNRATGFALDGTDRDIYTHSPNFGDHQHWGFFRA